MPSRPIFVLTLMAPSHAPLNDTLVFNELCQILPIERIKTLCDHKAYDLFFPLCQDIQDIYKHLKAYFGFRPIDFVLQENKNRKKMLLVADMDSTLIRQETLNELAYEIGQRELIASYTARAMQGEMDFKTSLRERVALFKNTPLYLIDKVLRDRISFTEGAQTLLQTMKKNGAYTAIVSSAPSLFVAPIAQKLGFDTYRANILRHNDECIEGILEEPFLGAQGKLEHLYTFLHTKNIKIEESLAVGDGANDLLMLTKAGLGVAFHACPHVVEKTQHHLQYTDLTSLLYIQGYAQQDFCML